MREDGFHHVDHGDVIVDELSDNLWVFGTEKVSQSQVHHKGCQASHEKFDQTSEPARANLVKNKIIIGHKGKNNGNNVSDNG